MATYADYLALIDGKTFTAQNLFIASGGTETSSTAGNVTNYMGNANSFVTANNQSGTVHTIDATQGTFSIGSNMFQIHGASTDGNDLFFSPVGGQGRLYLISNTGSAPTGNVVYATGNTYSAPTPTCFTSGTRIGTVSGEVAVEDLRVGDMVLVQGGEFLPIRWIGRRQVELADNPWRSRMLPIRIEAGTCGGCLPQRDLLLSPGHGVAVEGKWLLQAERLENGSSIARVENDRITYWHVEVERHAIIFAEGLPVESFLDVGNRGAFENGMGAIDPHASLLDSDDRRCLPLLVDREVIAWFRDLFDPAAHGSAKAA